MSMAESRLVELERRVELVLKGLNLLLFSEGETVSEEEKKELERRLKDYVKGKSSEFLELKDLQGLDKIPDRASSIKDKGSST